MAEKEDIQQEIMAQTKKRARGSPCGFEAFDPNTKKNTIYYPAVACHGECDWCGWNPEVRKKRVDKMLAELASRKKGKK